MSKVATRYAKSLIELALERKELEKINEDVQLFKEVVKNKDFRLLLNSPIVKTDKKQAIFDAIFGNKLMARICSNTRLKPHNFVRLCRQNLD